MPAEDIPPLGEGSDACKRLLAALSRDLPADGFSWRRPAVVEDAAASNQRKESTLEEMRRRMAAMCSPQVQPTSCAQMAYRDIDAEPPPPKEAAGPFESETAAMASDATAAFPPPPSSAANSAGENAGVGDGRGDPPRDRRGHFLDVLTQSLRQAEESSAACRPSSARPSSAASRQGTDRIETERAEGSADASVGRGVDVDLGPGFFAEMQALQDRLAQRKQNTREVNASLSRPTTPCAGSRTASPTIAVGSNLPTRPSHIGSATRQFPPTPLGSESDPRCYASAPRVAEIFEDGREPLPQSERRRPRPGRSASVDKPSVRAERSTDLTDDELLRTSSDDLLSWANEVLRKAQQAEVSDDPWSQVKGETPPCAPRAPRPPGPSSSGARERRRRAEELRGVMRRLQAESENECDRMAAEAARRQHSNVGEGCRDAWRDRVNSAAEELRSNLERGFCFERPGVRAEKTRPGGGRVSDPGGTGPTGHVGPRGCSQPPPRPPGTPSRPSPLTPRRGVKEHSAPSWARLEEKLESGTELIRYSDIPWPASTVAGSLTGVVSGDSPGVVRRKLAAALRRWHPDKWRRILDRVPEAEHARVMESVKTVAQRLLEEKAKLTSAGGLT
eukprot:TRINITY_DN29332_c0_g1_i1.p1 TRINITY_DN29332_c0_g1~~TRINITY_DN29332_c0_g1_i1.p1  ORF type:complete len:649 (-),score=78.13 TRINITY_DN29332_c0_g1_i1:193-2049(-)